MPDRTEAVPVAAVPPAAGAARWVLLFGIWLVYLSFGMITVSLAPVVAPITRDLGLSHGAMGSVLGIWQLVYIAAAIPCGALLDRLGARRALFIGALIVAASGLARSFATDYATLLLAVGLFGIGGPIVSSGAPKAVSQLFTGSQRGLAMGIYITGPAMGSVIVLSLTNAVAMPALGHDWHRVLQLWSLCAFAGAVVWLLLSLHPVARRLDNPPESGPRPRQTEVIGSLLKLPAVRMLLLMAVGIFSFNHGLNNWLPELLRHDGMTAAAAGYWATIPTVVAIVGSLLIPRLATPERRFVLLAGLGLAAMFASLMLEAGGGPVLLVGLMLQGIARSSLMTVAILTLVEIRGVGEKYAGTATGLFFSAAEIGGAGGPIMLGVLYDATGGFDAGLFMLAGIGALLAVAALRLRKVSA
ncbi:MFS transporter [Thalassobaculum sp.]|uniref:MFS transporter n=1 Tax=Thalassobaculum sp. TaxID=2022740 RepID=UPI0032EED922